MFPIGRWDFAPTLGRENPPAIPSPRVFRSFPELARSLISNGHRSAIKPADRKGDLKMSSQSHFTRTLVAIVAAVVMSTVAVGAAVGPVQAVAYPVQVSTNA
jgi:hypothetical protein